MTVQGVEEGDGAEAGDATASAEETTVRAAGEPSLERQARPPCSRTLDALLRPLHRTFPAP